MPALSPPRDVKRPPAPLDVPDPPSLAPGVRLVGTLQGTAFQHQQWLIERDGCFIQLTELLYRLAEAIDGTRSLAEIADRVTARTQRALTAEHVRHVLVTKFVPLGLMATPAGLGNGAPAVRGPSPLSLNLRVKAVGAEVIDPFARVFQVFFAPLLVAPTLAAVAGAHVWLYAIHGVDEALRRAIEQPWQLLVALALTILAGVFHELGHAAALRYGGGRARSMGAGIYFIYPAFYTDTTDSYRLGRWARVRTDVAGFYFHLIFALGLVGLYLVSGQAFLLLVVLLIDLDIVSQLLPFMRFDGYWAFADLTGLPDPFSYLVPFARALVWRGSRGRDRLPPLKPWVKIAFGAYIVVGLPVLVGTLLLTLVRVPVIVEASLDGLVQLWRALSDSQAIGDWVAVAASSAQLPLVALPLAGVAYLLGSQALHAAKGLWAWSRPAPTRRLIACAATAASIVLVGFLWAPEQPYVLRNEPSGVAQFTIEERNHVTTPVDYPQVPPVGGDHAPIWQNCGFYAEPIPSEQAVHSLEHGAVWITYAPGLPPDQVSSLQQLAHTHTYVLVSPYPDLPAPVVASAWGRQLRLESANDPRLSQFAGAFRLGPQAPEQGGPCSGGRGTPET